jgi:transcriptional regulator with XRE-family HTH domain
MSEKDFARWLRRWMRAHDVDQQTLAARVGRSQSTVSRWLNGAIPDGKNLNVLSKVTGVPIADMLALDAQPTGSIPLVGVVSAGQWGEALTLEIDEQEFVPVPVRDAENAFAVRVEGRSMDLRYPPGTLLICKRFEDLGRGPQCGERVIVQRRAGSLWEATCKKLVEDDDGVPWLVPESSDPRHQAAIRADRDSEADEIVLHAKVIASYRPE